MSSRGGGGDRQMGAEVGDPADGTLPHTVARYRHHIVGPQCPVPPDFGPHGDQGGVTVNVHYLTKIFRLNPKFRTPTRGRRLSSRDWDIAFDWKRDRTVCGLDLYYRYSVTHCLPFICFHVPPPQDTWQYVGEYRFLLCGEVWEHYNTGQVEGQAELTHTHRHTHTHRIEPQ